MFSSPAKKQMRALKLVGYKSTIKHELKEGGQLLDLLDTQKHIVSFNLMLALLTGNEIPLL